MRPLFIRGQHDFKKPVLLVEILSRVTEGYNRGSKFEMYRSIPSLVEYMMADSECVHVELWRKEGGKWVLITETNDVNDSVEVKSIESTFQLNDFYGALEMIDRQEENS